MWPLSPAAQTMMQVPAEKHLQLFTGEPLLGPVSCLFRLTDCLWTRLRCSSVDVSEELTQVLDDVVCGGLEERIHSIWAHPQHPLGRPFNKVHTATTKNNRFQVIPDHSSVLRT